MRKIVIVALFACLGCLKEKDADPGTPNTFVRYFNGGFNDTAHDIKATGDGGYIILATTEVRPNEVTDPRFKIKLIKTDEFGGLQWQRVYPDYDTDPTRVPQVDDSISFRGRSIEVVRSINNGISQDVGYVVAGDSIHKRPGSQSHLRVMLTDLDGNITKAKNFKPNFAVNGRAVTINASGNYVVLGGAVNPQAANNMFLAELDKDLKLSWQQAYGAGTSTLSNRLFIDAQSAIFWSGTITKTTRSDIRFAKAPPNSISTDFDLPIGKPENNETGNDICRYGFGFAIIGTTDETGDDDILFKRLAPNGDELSSKTFGFPNQAENGLSICQARDGGLVLLGMVDTNVDIGRGGKDYFLIKINAFGDTEWTQVFGSKNDDVGASVLANPDGSYTILGTALFGGLRTVALIKTDKVGRIE